MYKNILIFPFLFCCSYSLLAQVPTKIEVGKTYPDLPIKLTDSASYTFSLKKDLYYSIVVEQKGIDLVIILKNKNGINVQQMDSPNGENGPEKINFSPDENAAFTLIIKHFISDDETTAKDGRYAVSVNLVPGKLASIEKPALLQDFDILKNAFVETRVGLWYNSYLQFDSLCAVQRSKISHNMNALEFYQVIAPIVTYTKEGHSAIRISDETLSYFMQNGYYFPFIIKIINGKAYVINDLYGFNTKGMLLTKINNKSIDDILKMMLTIEPADGYNITSKFHWIETAFSKYYTYFFPASKSFSVVLTDPISKKEISYNNVPSYSFKNYKKLTDSVAKIIPNYKFKEASFFSVDPLLNTATLTINTFNTNNYKGGRKGFQSFLDSVFKIISDKDLKNLVIDIRKNEGGAQGMEDHLLSYLIDKPYLKYKYVEIPSFNYSFLQYTDYKNQSAILEKELKEDFFLSTDGRYLNLKGHYEGDTAKATNFKGHLYILISGLTFSGGSEFAALAKNYTNAIFIGEETGGGYYGNTSGSFLKYTLPHSKLTGRIPLCKFVVQDKVFDIPFGHGVMPDYFIQPGIGEYLQGHDMEMEYVKKLIADQ